MHTSRHVRFSIRCAYGKLALVRAYSLHIWIESGSAFCGSSGLHSSTPGPVLAPASERRSENMPAEVPETAESGGAGGSSGSAHRRRDLRGQRGGSNKKKVQ